MPRPKKTPARGPDGKLFRERLREAMVHAGIPETDKGSELGRRLDLNRQTVNRWLNSDATPELDMVTLIAERLGVDPLWLIKGDRPMVRTLVMRQETARYGDEEELLDNFRNLPDGWRYHIARKARDLRTISDKLPPFVRNSFRTIPEESNYWQWERDLGKFVQEQLGIHESSNGYVGPDRRVVNIPPEHERRQDWKVASGAISQKKKREAK